MNEKAGLYQGLKINEARQKVVHDMQEKGLISKIDENYQHSVGVCFKCGTVIEPRILDQWWVSLTKPGEKTGKILRDLALNSVKQGKSKFLTERYENQFYRWMENVRDWNVSRQIAWGIQLPVWYDKNGDVIVTDGDAPANADELTRETDVFDTWFSSCQWPFATLGNHDNDLDLYYPTTALVTGYDILFFWVSRMIMLSYYTQGQTPYQTIYIHGLVRDKDRQKMSKSKGNVMDPLGVADEYGADALRFALLYGTAPGTDPVISEEKIRGMRNFTTKIWNIARFIKMTISDTAKSQFIAVTDADSQIKKAFENTKQTVEQAMETYQLHVAAESLYDFVWHDFADAYLEATKEDIKNEATKETTEGNLLWLLERSLELLHPFVPFVTEGVWQELHQDDSLMNRTIQKEMVN